MAKPCNFVVVSQIIPVQRVGAVLGNLISLWYTALSRRTKLVMARYDFSSIRPSKPTYPKSTSAILLAGKVVVRKR